jgi:hypothetical protein
VILVAEQNLASPVNSLVAGIIGFMIAYALASLIGEALTGHAAQARRRVRVAPTEQERRDPEAE